MSSDWPTKTLDDVCEKITDGAHASPNSVINGKYMASVKDLTPFGVDLSSARQIDVEDFNKLVKQGCRPEVGDVLIAKDGNSALDTVCTVRKPLDAVLLSSVAILRPDTEQLDYDFLKYYFSSKSVIEYLKSNFISGAAIPRVVLRDFRKAKIKLPPLDVQKKIVAVLNSLNDKIELNIQINETLEAMAEVIFKSWFVDFEPVKAKISAIEASEDAEDVTRAAMSAISGKTDEELDQLQAEQPENYTQLKTTAELFPFTMQDSELGELPEGWRAGDLGEFASISSGKRPKLKSDCKNKEFNVPLIGASSIMGYVNEILYKESILVIGRVGTHGIVQRTFQPSYPSDNTLVIRSKYHEYVYQILNSIDYGSLNVGSTQPLITQTSIKHSKIVIPDKSLLDRFENISASMFSKINSNNTENQNLCDLRDSLLPKLLSGELSVDAADLAEGN
ncbi:restriction endonuclease subunit S [Methanosarcina mazei]|uniref:Type I restriction modification DNA specificity domain-containing protein n=1 Tax=Methanosarcina mazei TaxID=2209 RepID=A0A0F8ID58_METMZ|nr:restriction endonuclease subunit S [Methanosarcina mazei]KKG61443.1 hypothetical protein DU67_05730 [Methanosarcina mazei]